jgi:hypothetical protein
MHDYGIQVELNKSIRWLSAICGVEIGVMLGIMIPVAAQTLLFGWLNWPVAFALMIGFRGKLFLTQLASMQFEKQLNKIQKELLKQQIQKHIGGCDVPPSNVNPASDQKPDESGTAPTPSVKGEK